jgi:hypothetical protein
MSWRDVKEGVVVLIELLPCDFPGGGRESKEIDRLVRSIPRLRLEYNI